MSIESITFGTETEQHTITADPARRMRVVTPEGEKLLNRDELEADILATMDRKFGRAGGTPSAPKDEFPAGWLDHLAAEVRPPMDETFGDEDFLAGGAIEALAETILQDCAELSHLVDLPIAYLWKRKGGASQGNPNLGKCVALSGAARYFGRHEYLVWLAADHVRDAALDPSQRTALVYHQLRHIALVVDEDPDSKTYGEEKIKLIGHDFEGFWSELSRFGAWSMELRTTVNTVEQLRLGIEGAA